MKLKQSSQCSKCLQLNNTFIDLSATADGPIDAIANLFMRSRHDEPLDNDTVSSVGHTLLNYLEIKRIREHVFLGRSLPSHFLLDPDLKAEFQKLLIYKQKAKSTKE